MGKIKTQEISFRNMFSYGNKWQTFPFHEGITFITGHNTNNDRRNFTGKTNLLRMLPYSLFGKVDGIPKKGMVNWKNRKNAECSITFEKDGNKYCIHRGIKPDFLKVYENDNVLPEPSNKKDFQSQIENEILGFDYNSFMNICYGEANKSGSILTLSKPMKRNFLEQIFYLDYYTKLKEKINKKINNLKTSIASLESEIESNNTQKQSLGSQIRKFNADLSNVEDSSGDLKEVNEQLTGYDEYSKYSEELEKLKNELSTVQEEYKGIKSVCNKISSKIKELQSRYRNVEEVTEEESENVRVQIQDMDQQIENTVLHEINESVDEYKSSIDKLTNEYYQVKSEISSLEKENSNIDSLLKEKSGQGECPYCYQTIDMDVITSKLHSQKEEIQSKLTPLYDKKTELQEQIDTAKSKLQILEDKKEENVKFEKTIGELEKKKQKLEYEYNSLQEKWNLFQQSVKYQNVIDRLNNVWVFKSTTEEILESKTNSLKESVESIESTIHDMNKLYEKKQLLESKVEQERKERDRITQWIEDNKKEIEQLDSDIQDKQDKCVKHKNMLDYLDVLKDLTSDEEAKQYTISNKIPLLNKQVNYYLSQAGVNYYVKLDNWLDVEIKGPGIKDCSYENLSGAERTSLDRALQFSFHYINKLQSPNYLDVLVLDELLDSSVDTQGLKNMMGIISAKQKEDDLKVLLVSHRESLEDLDKYIDNHYTVEYNGNYSRIVNV